jgi:hypothetical protein
MSLEKIMLAAAALVFILSLFLIPKAKRHQAQFVFLFIQLPTWVLGLVAVETGLLRYPVHELPRANSTSFVFEYLILPIYCIHFNARFPEKSSTVKKLFFYGAATGALTGIEVIVERHTEIITYTGWKWYFTFFSVMFILWLSRAVTGWFFRQRRRKVG